MKNPAENEGGLTTCSQIPRRRRRWRRLARNDSRAIRPPFVELEDPVYFARPEQSQSNFYFALHTDNVMGAFERHYLELCTREGIIQK